MAIDNKLKNSLKEINDNYFSNEMMKIRSLAAINPEHEFVKSNGHLLKESNEVWHCAGIIEMGGVAWWALSLQLDFEFPKVVIFTASGGPDWAFSAFTGPVAGSFNVDPVSLSNGDYHFSLSQASVEIGACTFSLYTKSDKKYIGSVTGVVGGGGFSNISGVGHLKVMT